MQSVAERVEAEQMAKNWEHALTTHDCASGFSLSNREFHRL